MARIVNIEKIVDRIWIQRHAIVYIISLYNNSEILTKRVFV